MTEPRDEARDVLAEDVAAARLTAWAECVQRLIAVAPTEAVINETGIAVTGHATPPERKALRKNARAVVASWLARDLAKLAARGYRLTPEPAPDVEALRVAAQAVIGDPADWPPDDEWDEAFLALRAALHPADPSQTPEVATWLAIRAALHEAANDKCRDGRFDHCYDQFHSPPIKFADWWPPADPSRREP